MTINFADTMDIIDALHLFRFQKLSVASLELFGIMNYPVPLNGFVDDVDVNDFVYKHVERKQYYSKAELDVLKNASTISYLFRISKDSIGLEKVRSVIVDNVEIDSVVFLSVDLRGDKANRSYNAYYITQVLSRCYEAPVLILFRFDHEVMFAGQNCIAEQKMKAQVLLSDWYSSKSMTVEEIYRLSDLCLDRCSNRNFYEMYMDMLWSVARIYYIYPENRDKLGHGMFSYNYIYSRYDIDNESNLGNYLAQQLQDYEQGKSFYKDLYGDDYIQEDAIIETLEDDWYLDDDGDDLFDPSSIDETEFLDDSLEELGEDEQVPDFDTEEEIDDDIFDDPIKMLKYLEGR